MSSNRLSMLICHKLNLSGLWIYIKQKRQFLKKQTQTEKKHKNHIQKKKKQQKPTCLSNKKTMSNQPTCLKKTKKTRSAPPRQPPRLGPLPVCPSMTMRPVVVPGNGTRFSGGETKPVTGFRPLRSLGGAGVLWR